MKFHISTKLFPSLVKLDRRKGENRLRFFRRQFKGIFTKAQNLELETFIIANGFRPMEPVWPNQGCYILAAADNFEKHPQRDRYLSALMLSDLVWAYPKLEPLLVDKIELVLNQRADRYKQVQILLRKVKERNATYEKQIRLLASNLRKRNRPKLQKVQRPKRSKRTRDSDNEGA